MSLSRSSDLHHSQVAILLCSFDGNTDIVSAWDAYHFSRFPQIYSSFKVYYGFNYLSDSSYGLNAKCIRSMDSNWAISLSRWLQQIPENNLLLMLDDMFIKSIDKAPFALTCQLFKRSCIDYMPISSKIIFSPTKLTSKKILFKVQGARYSVNLQPALWKKEALANLILRVSDPWQFEQTLSTLYNKSKLPLNVFACANSGIKFYEQFCERGQVYKRRIMFLDSSLYSYLFARRSVAPLRCVTGELGLAKRYVVENIRYLFAKKARC